MKHLNFKDNSLDLLRLLAATQVMVLHSFEFTMVEATNSLFFEALRLFPGVPIFFFVSGYLISRSYERSPNIKSYWSNRCLRIFPALIVCNFINILLVASTGYLNKVDASFADVSLLFLAKSTFLQFYNPDFMRQFGDGVLNGSLWTICVELQFYFLVPIIYKILSLKDGNGNLKLIILILVFMIANRLLYLWQPEYSDDVIWKLYRVSFMPWIYMFLVGVLFQKNFQYFYNLLSNISFSKMLLIYVAIMSLVSYSGFEFGNSIAPYIFIPLSLLIFKFSYSFIEVSKSLKGNDVSYGIYIWHMVFINQLIYMTNGDLSFIDVSIVIIITILTALLSWRLIEKPSIALKKYSINK